MGRQNEDAHKYVPEKMETFNDSKIVSVGLGSSFIGILCESKEEFKETEFVLKSGEEMTVQNKMNDVENRMAHNVFVKNKDLFGDDDWMEIESNAKYLSLDALNIIKTDQQKKEFLDNAQNYSFDKIEEI